MRILITGAGGGVGGALARHFSQRHEVLACTRETLDITDREQVTTVVREFRPEVMLNPAAITDVDRCERETNLAYLVNGLAPAWLARAAEDAGAVFIQFSTDYVFSGRDRTIPYTENDEPDPFSVYGRAKLNGERAALEICARTYVVRTAWLMNPHRPGFLSAMVAAAQRGHARVARQVSSPTGLSDLVQGVETLLEKRPEYDIYHLVNSGRCSREELAREIFRLLGVNGSVEEVPLATFTATPRPTFSALEAWHWHIAGFTPFRPWQLALADALREAGYPVADA